MRRLIGGSVLVAAALTCVAPLSLAAQRRAGASTGGAKHEFGIDVGVFYSKQENVDGGIVIGTPLDVRVGLMSGKKMMWEPRLTLAFDSRGGTTGYLLGPGVNALVSTTPGGHRTGMYWTVGGNLLIGDTGANSGTAFSVNGGVGWRKPYGSGAFRYELILRYDLESTDLGIPNTLNIGARVGLSLWH